MDEPGRGLSFGSVAHNYALFRPSYPPAAVDFVLHGMQPRRIVDLGAGTGKLTELLRRRAPELIAVEPDPAMLAELSRALPDVVTMSGRGEQIDLPDRSTDAIFVGQAFHWFTRPDADHEMARILRPGGVVGLVWNFPDTSVDWVAALYDRTTGTRPDQRPQTNLAQPLFDTGEVRWFDSEHPIAGPAGLLQLVHTWSWVIARPPEDQAGIDAALTDLVAEHPELQGEVIVLPQRTKAVRQYRR